MEMLETDREKADMFTNFIFLALPGMGLIAMGIKALTPAGIQLTDNKKLNPRVSMVIGVVTLLLGSGTVLLAVVLLIFPDVIRFLPPVL